MRIGDLIQIEINGALKYQRPEPIKDIQFHDDGFWVFIDSSKSGVPIDQVILIEPQDTHGPQDR
jgi:hypothetical protein